MARIVPTQIIEYMDSRFPQARARAEQLLQNLIEYENLFNRSSEYDRVKSVNETKYNFRLGKD